MSDQNGHVKIWINGGCIFDSFGNRRQRETQHCFCSQNIHRVFSYRAWFPYSRYRSLSVVDGLSRPLQCLGRWESLPVGGLSGPLTVFSWLNCYF